MGCGVMDSLWRLNPNKSISWTEEEKLRTQGGRVYAIYIYEVWISEKWVSWQPCAWIDRRKVSSVASDRFGAPKNWVFL